MTMIGPDQIPASPPDGFVYLKIPSPQVQDFVKALSGVMGEIGTMVAFPINGVSYIARVEPLAPDKDNPNWRKGLVVYIQRPKNQLPQPKDIVKAASNPKIVGASSGAVAGFYIGGPVGAAVGTAVGYVGSLIYKDIKK